VKNNTKVKSWTYRGHIITYKVQIYWALGKCYGLMSEAMKAIDKIENTSDFNQSKV